MRPLTKAVFNYVVQNWFNCTFIFSWMPDPDSEEEKDIDASMLKRKWKQQMEMRNNNCFSGHLQQRNPNRRQTFCYIWWDVFPSMNPGENGWVLAFLSMYKLNDSLALNYFWKKNLIEQLWAGSIILFRELLESSKSEKIVIFQLDSSTKWHNLYILCEYYEGRWLIGLWKLIT